MFSDCAGNNVTRLIERSIGIEFVVVVALNDFHRRHEFTHVEALQKSLQDIQTVGGNGFEGDSVVHGGISCWFSLVSFSSYYKITEIPEK